MFCTRCTCYGIAAASGKLGAVFVQIAYIYFDNGGLTTPNSASLGKLMYIFAAFMLLVAIVAWAYIPNVQKQGPRVQAESRWNPGHIVENEKLEDLAEGRKLQTAEQKVGFRARLATLRRRPEQGQHDEQDPS